MGLQFTQANLVRDRTVLARFNIDYLDWIGESVRTHYGLELTDLLGEAVPEYVERALDKLCDGTPPDGIFYIVHDGETPAGMGGLRRVTDGVCEVKRVFVPPAARGSGAGAKILSRLMSDARAFGYREVVLDTGPFMTSAHRLYEAEGFTDIPPYAGAEVPEPLHHDWRFMRCELA